ncbi:MAG TPA: hypothetical protein VGC30_15250, partial [Dokdonella sp.]
MPDAAPATWRAGRVLDAADADERARSFARMCAPSLRCLCASEQRFGAQIAALEAAPGEARAAQRLALLGCGLWPDGWAARTFSACFVSTR